MTPKKNKPSRFQHTLAERALGLEMVSLSNAIKVTIHFIYPKEVIPAQGVITSMKSLRGKISGLHFKGRREATTWLTSCLTPQRSKRSHARAVGMGYHRSKLHACEVTSDGDVFGTV